MIERDLEKNLEIEIGIVRSNSRITFHLSKETALVPAASQGIAATKLRLRDMSHDGLIQMPIGSTDCCGADKGSFPHQDAHGNCCEKDADDAKDELRHPELCEGVDASSFRVVLEV